MENTDGAQINIFFNKNNEYLPSITHQASQFSQKQSKPSISIDLSFGYSNFSSIEQSLKNNQLSLYLYIYKMQECQILVSDVSPCLSCESKDINIEKCMHLIYLLKKKAKRYDDSKLRESRSLSSNTARILPQPHIDLRGKIFEILVKQLERKHTLEGFLAIKSCDTMQGHLDQFSNGILGKQIKDKLFQFQTNESLHEVSQQKSESLPFIQFPFQKSHESYHKNRLKAEFQMMIQNKKLSDRVKLLQQELQQSLRRQEKEIAKKRQSLSGLVEQLSQKNEIIEDLKTNIKWLESKLGAKQNGVLQCMLEEDSEALRKVVFRLENINDKLNIDIDKIKKEKLKAQNENRLMKSQNQALKKEINTLKEQNFQLEHQKLHVNASKKQLEFISHKIHGKVAKILKLEKKWSIATKSKEIMENVQFQNTTQYKKISTESTDSLQTAYHNQQLEQKLQTLFIYLFHIQDMSFKLGSPKLFDQEEKELLSAHKQRYFQKLNQSFIFKKSPRDVTINEQKEEFNPFGDSVIDAFTHDLKPSIKENHQISDRMKLIQSSVQHSKLVQKISELKERNLYIRNVILTLLKTLEIRSLKKQTQGILTMLSDYFEYSEVERNQIYQAKSKKIFGFI